MNRTEKNQMVTDLAASVAKARNAFLIDFQGINVPEVTELRRQIREMDSQYVVVKNTLALIAIEDSPLIEMRDAFRGPTAVVYNDGDAVALAKTLTRFARDVPAVTFKGAMLDRRVVAADQIEAIANLPSREELIARLLFLMQSPMRGLVSVLNANIRNLAVVLDQVAKQKSGSTAQE